MSGLSGLTFISNSSHGCKHSVFDYFSYALSGIFMIIIIVAICRLKKKVKVVNANGQVIEEGGNVNQSLLSNENPNSSMMNGGSSYPNYFPANFNPNPTSTSTSNPTSSLNTTNANSTSVVMDNNNNNFNSNSTVDNTNSQYNYNYNYEMNYNIPQSNYTMNYGYSANQNTSMH